MSKALLVAQVAMSLILLLGAGLFVRTVLNLRQVDLGFNQENLLVFALAPGAIGYTGDRLENLYRQLFDRLEALPGVRSATFQGVPLIASSLRSSTLILPGETVESATERSTNLQIVRENYFDTMEIPVVRGRRFTEQDREGAPRVAIVSEAFARQYFPSQDPIGQRVGFDEKTVGQIEIVGIARDTKYNSQRQEIEPLLYTPWLQEKNRIGMMHFAVRTPGDPTALGDAVRQVVRDVDPGLPVTQMMTQEARSNETLASERVFAELLSFFGALALILAAIGLYGVMAYSVAQRTNEIGIRMALGARAGDVLWLVVWQGLKFVVVGLGVGAVAAIALKQIVESQLYGVDSSDPLTFAVVGVSLLATALLACLAPARRATKVDPAIALRNE